MLRFDEKTRKPVFTDGGYTEGAITDTYVRIGDGMQYMHAVLYEPVDKGAESRIGVVVVHSDDDYSTFPIAPELAKRGYRVLAGQVTNFGSTQDDKMLDILHCVEFLKGYDGIEKVVLMGHSGGATLMSAYQAAAEKGVEIFRGENMLIKLGITEKLIPADAVMLLDSNWGNGSMTVLSIDPAVVEEGTGVNLLPELNIFEPANGFDPAGSHYSEEFLQKFFSAQSKRNNAIIDRALERLEALESGNGTYLEDEPFVVTGAAQFGPCNKIIPQDVSRVAHTKEAHDLLHADGSVTHEIVRSLRKPHFDRSFTPSIHSCVITTVRSYLSGRAVRTNADYFIHEDCITGIEWENTYNCTPGNVRFVNAPILIMGMTGSYEYLAAEKVYENCASADKTLLFMEAASHNFFREETVDDPAAVPGDTARQVFDAAARWMREHM